MLVGDYFNNADLVSKLGSRLPRRVFHNYIHRYFVIALRIALTAMKQLFSLADVDG